MLSVLTFPAAPARCAALPHHWLETLRQFCDSLERASAADGQPGRWRVPDTFFFNHNRRMNLGHGMHRPQPLQEPIQTPIANLQVILAAASANVRARHALRAVPRIRERVSELAPCRADVRQLFSLLSLVDDEVVIVLDPAARRGWRTVVRAIGTLGDFHLQLAARMNPVDDELTVPRRVRWRFYHPRSLSKVDPRTGLVRDADQLLEPQPFHEMPCIDGERVLIIDDLHQERPAWPTSDRSGARPEITSLIELTGKRYDAALARVTGVPAKVHFSRAA